jgi:hypothetical protein
MLRLLLSVVWRGRDTSSQLTTQYPSAGRRCRPMGEPCTRVCAHNANACGAVHRPPAWKHMCPHNYFSPPGCAWQGSANSGCSSGQCRQHVADGHAGSSGRRRDSSTNSVSCSTAAAGACRCVRTGRQALRTTQSSAGMMLQAGPESLLLLLLSDSCDGFRAVGGPLHGTWIRSSIR